MDITRNWRLKTSRSQLLASRCPVTGEVVLPQHAVSTAERFRTALEDEFSLTHRVAVEEYAQAAR